MKNPKISIITVVKNNEKLIERNILSLLNQKYKNYEQIIIDGNSTDGTIKIIEKYSKHIEHFISEEDDGLYYAMNKGIDLASGEIIGILNSDDYYYENALEIVKNYFEEKPKLDFLFGSVIKSTLQHGFYPKKIYRTFGFYTTHSVGFFIKTKSQKKLGYYNTKYKYSSDYDLFYRMIVKYQMLGTSTKKNEILGFFEPDGFSSKIKYIDYLNENTQIRLNNGQNKIIVWLIHFLRLSKRIFIVMKESKKK
mgnify:FL=1|tara:strand:- start:846 stop:1598 length:753 start_codon:yes stop_codon:yes gene_type:complete